MREKGGPGENGGLGENGGRKKEKIFRVLATTPAKTHNQTFLTFETILNRFLVQFYPGFSPNLKTLSKPPK